MLHRFHIDIESFAAEVVAARSGNDERVVVKSLSSERFCHLENALTRLSAFAGESCSLRHEVQFETIGKHHVSRFVEELRALFVCEVRHRGEAMSAMCTLFLDAVFCFHREFASHLVAIVAIEIGIQQFVVARNGASDARGVSGEDGAHFGAVVLQEQHAET